MQKICTQCNWFTPCKTPDPEVVGHCDLFSGNITYKQALLGCANWKECENCEEVIHCTTIPEPQERSAIQVNKRVTLTNQKTIIIRTGKSIDSEKAWNTFSSQPSAFYRYIHGITQDMVQGWYPKDKLDFNKEYPINAFTINEKDEEGEFIGNAMLLFNNNLSHRSHVAKFGFGIIPEYQGMGIGKELLSTTLNVVKNFTLIKKIQTEVVCENYPAVSLYLKAGFKVEGCRVASWVIEDKVYDTYILGKLL